MLEIREMEQELEQAKTELANRYGVRSIEIGATNIYIYTGTAGGSMWIGDEEPMISMVCNQLGEPTIEAMQQTIDKFEADKEKIMLVIKDWQEEIAL